MSAKRPGRPPLTEGRKAEIRRDIARAAVRLFTTRGVAATSAEEIASEAGVSLRTLWRYFPGPGKENCVRPLLSTGIEEVARALAGWSPDEDLPEALERLPRPELADVDTMLDLVRLTRTEPGVRAVWLRAHQDAEPVFAAGIAERSGRDPGDLDVKVEAAVVNAAMRVAVEHSADQEPPDLWGALRTALRATTRR
ncbi:TetR/AcrR family transcriptional regulator [Saccharopolyspora sp. CA-218241]|uniref:TetR/AcrR family transcriptional regulator n=1 Tax=Saccharopolyspora sp. CA-218241 TaxID=3240027 RepID=UPI003D99A4EE